MRTLRSVTLALVALTLAAGCEDEKKTKPVAGCDEALARAKQMLAIADLESARDWSARAKTLCAADGAKAVSDLEAEIAAAKDRLKKREEATLGVVPAIVKAVGDYRAQPQRELCKKDMEDGGRCLATGDAAGLAVQLWTQKAKAASFAALALVKKRGLRCELFGSSEVKKSHGSGDTQSIWCTIHGGPLAELDVLLLPDRNDERTEVHVFSASWLEHDELLLGLIRELDEP